MPNFEWTEDCQKNFLEIKDLITKAPVLHLPRGDYMYRLYIDTSREATGASIYQVPHKDSTDEKLIGYYSRNLPSSAKSYSVSELEAAGILTTLEACKNLKNKFIQIFTDHSSLVHILKSEKEIPTMRLKKIAEKLSEYHFEIGYRKGSEMTICDWLSRSYYEDDVTDPVPPLALKSTKVDNIHVGMTTRSQTKISDLPSAYQQNELEDIEEEDETDYQEDNNQLEAPSDDESIVEPEPHITQDVNNMDQRFKNVLILPETQHFDRT
jgi:hypothetical protein